MSGAKVLSCKYEQFFDLLSLASAYIIMIISDGDFFMKKIHDFSQEKKSGWYFWSVR